MKILLVEDNAADRRLYKEAFETVCPEAELTMVEDGVAAVEYLFPAGGYSSMADVDLILLDLNLPKKGGREVLAEIKKNELGHYIPVIILTSSTADSDICACYKENATCYLVKPMNFTDLLNLVKLISDFWIKQVRYCPR